MIRTIFIPYNNDIILPIPQEYIGKKLEVIVFPIEEPSEKESIQREVTFTDFGLDTPGYKFDREEANAR